MLILFRVTQLRNPRISAKTFVRKILQPNKLPWDPAAQLLRSREPPLQPHLLAQHSPVWSQNLLSKQIKTMLFSHLNAEKNCLDQ